MACPVGLTLVANGATFLLCLAGGMKGKVEMFCHGLDFNRQVERMLIDERKSGHSDLVQVRRVLRVNGTGKAVSQDGGLPRVGSIGAALPDWGINYRRGEE